MQPHRHFALVLGFSALITTEIAHAQTLTATASVQSVRPVEDPEQRVPVTFDRALPSRAHLTASGDIVTEAPPPPLLEEWWFWAAMVAAAGAIVTLGVVVTAPERFVPGGELGASRTDEWMRF